jgi:hypothetical protein
VITRDPALDKLKDKKIIFVVGGPGKFLFSLRNIDELL